MIPRPSAPIARVAHSPTSPTESSVVIVAAVQARLLQWATFRSPFVSSWYAISPSPSAPIASDAYRPMSADVASRIVRVVGAAAPDAPRTTATAPTHRFMLAPRKGTAALPRGPTGKNISATRSAARLHRGREPSGE